MRAENDDSKRKGWAKKKEQLKTQLERLIYVETKMFFYLNIFEAASQPSLQDEYLNHNQADV